ncbi:MAG TPA: hypothetical protein VME44_20460 [Streptosporangiaceae bacterium]|nr:hypothetical protein [Streptosporangiaceae bacterium]
MNALPAVGLMNFAVADGLIVMRTAAESTVAPAAALFGEDGSAAFDDEHGCYFRRLDWSAVTATCTVMASRTAR